MYGIHKCRFKLQNVCYCYGTFTRIVDYKRYYAILGIAEDSDQEGIRKAYLALVKKYHPDSGTEDADVRKFQEIDKAFKILLNKKSKERWNVDDEQEQDIKHVAPQHRQYLSYEGTGTGTPAQRQKQYTKMRAAKAVANVLEHRIAKASAEDKALWDKNNTVYKHKIKTKYGYERLVEDLIQEAMSKGEFSNLSGLGKPLPQHQNTNPYVDFVTHKLNQVLIDNGFTPEWITLQKDIREEIQSLRENLTEERKDFEKFPLQQEDLNNWNEIVTKYESTASTINKRINKYNLVVPMINKQMIQINLANEANNILKNGMCSTDSNIERSRWKQSDGTKVSKSNEESNIFGFFDAIFKKQN